MLKQSVIVALVASWAMVAPAAVFEQTYSVDSLVPDAPHTGLFNVQTVDLGAGSSSFKVVSVSVTLNLDGGFNGDLYAYLSHGGQKAVLLNRVGRADSFDFGYTDAGMSVTLADGNPNIHTYGGAGVPNGTFAPDGRATDPYYGGLTSDAVTEQMSVFNGNGNSANALVANGDWTLFIADLSSGGQSHLSSWKLHVEAIPEPIHVALAIFGGLFAGVGLMRSKLLRRGQAQKS